ncbi:exonuclease domain-containing protein [Tsuneonella amylolytica]|uniref:exonuclease domain-containing protein n=1 Tax=Tsuneonella amylolytica TaxID=2338327 RepID=UPI00389A3A43
MLDVETTGLDAIRHSIVELCAARIAIDGKGAVVAIECIRVGLRHPGQPLSEAIREISGLNDEDLAGQSIDPDDLMSFLDTGAAVVAFNTGFDRPFVEGIAPEASPLRWGCPMHHIPWRALGFEPGSQGYLLCQSGWHRDNRCCWCPRTAVMRGGCVTVG